MVATMKEIENLRRKIHRSKNPKTLEKYFKQMDDIIIELDKWLEAHKTKPSFRHSYAYEAYEKRFLRRSALR
jgi:hypothetical protein